MSDIAESSRVPPEQLRKSIDASRFAWKSTEELDPLETIIGQDRAVGAIGFGVDIDSEGYNIFAVGPPGSGRTTAVRQFLTRRAAERPQPDEWCYVHNFQDPRRPSALSLAPGRAAMLRDGMEEVIEQLEQEIPRTFEGEFYEQRRREILLDFQERQQELLHQLEQYLNERNFALIRGQMGLAIAPVVDGQVLSAEEYEQLDPEQKRVFESHRPQLQEQYDRTMRETRELDRERRRSIENLKTEMAGFVADQVMEEIMDTFSDNSGVTEYLKAVRDDIVQHADEFMLGEEQDPQAILMQRMGTIPSTRTRYTVNVLASDCEGGCAPIVIEDNPTYHNLIGRIEHRTQFGAMFTDFTQIRAGALHRANGGYLVAEAKNVLSNPLSWDALKRALRNRRIKIEEMSQFYGLLATVTLEPEPIPLDIKVVLIGDERLYQLLYALDEDFRELFKVKAEFALRADFDDGLADSYARFIGDLCRRESLPAFDALAAARVIEEASRYAEDQEKVTVRMAQVADLIREAAYWAREADHDAVGAEDVRKAIDEWITRQEAAAERYRESIAEGSIFIDTQGEVVGQINGLSIIQTGNFSFGIPSRVTARTFMGRSGIASIDREVKMSGPIHDKGQLILSSYLASHFAQDQALTLSASLTFEQLYSGVEGDSASSTELYALLSSLADVPIKQNLAVTGSVNQLGQVQPIGGVNAKIEGFYDVCREMGLTGEQGVLIPRANLRNLMLREDVVQAVREGKFHIHAVSRVEEGIELLTGVPAGERDENGEYPEGTIYAKVRAKLQEYAAKLKKNSKEQEVTNHLADEQAGGSDQVKDEAD
ncbi:MAG: Lon protease family protein [Anaerolineae bacterium]